MKRTTKDIVKSIKSREKSELKENITFRVQKELLKKFREKCLKSDVSLVSVIEEMMTSFIND